MSETVAARVLRRGHLRTVVSGLFRCSFYAGFSRYGWSTCRYSAGLFLLWEIKPSTSRHRIVSLCAKNCMLISNVFGSGFFGKQVCYVYKMLIFQISIRIKSEKWACLLMPKLLMLYPQIIICHYYITTRISINSVN